MFSKFFLTIFTAISIFTFAACNSQNAQTTSNEVKRYELNGKIISVNAQKREATIQHDEIKGYMPAMTMAFPFGKNDVWALRELKAGDKIGADLVIESDQSYFLEKVSISQSRDASGETAMPVELDDEKIGAEVPNFALTNQDDKRIAFNDFRGKYLLTTFIYVRCPLPDYCPLMSIRFSDLEKQIKSSPELSNKIRLLSITFDPKNDTPKVLKTYGTGYLNKETKPTFDIWQLATGSEQEIKDVAAYFGLNSTPDGTQIIHNLRTALISPEGKIIKIYSGNEWKTTDILNDIKK